MLLLNFRLHLFLGKLKSKWSGPFLITKVSSHGAVQLENKEDTKFTVNGQSIKIYLGIQRVPMKWLRPITFMNSM